MNYNDHTINSNLVDKKIKFIHWNANNKANLTPDLGPHLKNKKSNIFLSINESFALTDLSIYKLVGVRHQNLLTRGLSLYISDHLRHYTNIFFSKFTINGVITLPSNNPNKEPLSIGFVSTYRSPSLTLEQEIEFFTDLNQVQTELLEKTSLIYTMGDFNAWDKRFYKNDTTKVAPIQKTKNYHAYQSLLKSAPGPMHFYFQDTPTHFPYQKNIQTCSQLDYIYLIHASPDFPKGKETLWITSSDHRALILQINVPFVQNIKVRFNNYDKTINSDYTFIDYQIFTYSNSLKWDPESAWDNFTRIEILKNRLLRSHSLHLPQRRPTATKNYDSKIKILQNNANIARKKGDYEAYNKLVKEIQEAITNKAITALDHCGEDEDKQTGVFYRWAGSILKPCKSETGKYCMTDQTVKEITDPINSNYIDPDPILPTFRSSSLEQQKALIRACNKFNFARILGKIRKVPAWFKSCSNSVIYIAERLCLAIILEEDYPPVLKMCQADILPSRSIFQMLNPFSKLVENFFASELQKLLGDCENFAYRPNLSTTSLLLVQFDILARNKLVYGFNGDLKKAFDRLSRKLVYDRIQNSALANIIWSWLDRKDSPYYIHWRGDYSEISRDDFNRGCPPGSICGPITYILGQSDFLNFNGALFKALFADDSLPLYLDQVLGIDDAEQFVDFVNENGMEMHSTGSKAAVYIAFGKEAPKDTQNEWLLATNQGSVTVKRTWKIRQLGLDIAADPVTGRATILLEKLIDKLKHASVAIRVLATGTLTSLMIDLIRPYLISLISYCIVVWYPIMMIYDVDSVNRVRYWYYSVLCYACTDTKQLLSWSNSHHTLRKGHSCEQKFKDLCGLPTLEELYIASTKAHFPQIRNMVSKGWLDRIIWDNRDKLHYLCKSQICKGLVSPLHAAVEVLNTFGYGKLYFDTKDSWLVSVEKELKELKVSNEEIRLFQRAITAQHFNIQAEYLKRTKVSDKIRNFVKNKEKHIRKILKRYKRCSKKTNLLLEEKLFL